MIGCNDRVEWSCAMIVSNDRAGSLISKYKNQFLPFHCRVQNSVAPSADFAVRYNVI